MMWFVFDDDGRLVGLGGSGKAKDFRRGGTE